MELEALGEEIASLCAHIHAATYRLLVLVREFDERCGWTGDSGLGGFRSCAHWLSWRTGIALGAAREKVRVARALAQLPQVSASFERGEISYTKVRAMTRIATPAIEQRLLDLARATTASQLEKIVRSYRKAEPERERERARHQHKTRYVNTYYDDDGMLVIEGRLPPEVGARVVAALDAATDALREQERELRVDPDVDPGCSAERRKDAAPRTFPPQRRADGLGLVADSALAAGLPGRRAADTHHVVVHVDVEVLADPAADGRSELACGTGVSAETSRRLACDAAISTLIDGDGGMPLSIGRKRRTIPSAIRRALHSRGDQCAFPGCGHWRFLQAHHLVHWAEGGETKLENLALLCSFHHRLVHEGGYTVQRRDDGELVFRDDRGTRVLAAPPLPALPEDAVGTLQRAQCDHGIDASTIGCWNGDRLDYEMARDALVFAARRATPTTGRLPWGEEKTLLPPRTEADEG